MIKIMTEKRLNEIVSRARTEAFDEMHTARKFDDIERHFWELESRIARLENDGEVPTLTKL